MAEKFEIGRLLATPAALEAVEAAGDDLLTYVRRHAAGDRGTVEAGVGSPAALTYSRGLRPRLTHGVVVDMATTGR